jgi:uncharacterized protein (TIGR02246 family)
MKIRSVMTLVGLAISFAVPALAFEGNLAGDLKALDEFTAFGRKYDQACNNSDAIALAALFTEDAVLVTPEGLFAGRQAIEKLYAEFFERWHPINYIGQADQLNAIDKGAWAVGKWWCTIQTQNGPVFVRGYWSSIYAREGDAWKIRMSTFNQTLAPAAPVPSAETK